MDNILKSLFVYFNIDLKSSLKYSDTFLFPTAPTAPTAPSEGLISFKYDKFTGQFAYILYNNKDITIELKSKLKSIFDGIYGIYGIYENLDSVNLISSPTSFDIKLNFSTVIPKEIYNLIMAHLPSGKAIESWSKVSKYFESMITREIEDNFTNHLWTLIKLFPDTQWNWGAISRNPNTTSEPIGFLGTNFLKKVSSAGK